MHELMQAFMRSCFSSIQSNPFTITTTKWRSSNHYLKLLWIWNSINVTKLICFQLRLRNIPTNKCIFQTNIIVRFYVRKLAKENKYASCVWDVERIALRGSLFDITRLAEWCWTVLSSDGFFCPHLITITILFSCIPCIYNIW